MDVAPAASLDWWEPSWVRLSTDRKVGHVVFTVGVALPVFWWRGICWEAGAWAAAITTLGLLLLRLPRTLLVGTLLVAVSLDVVVVVGRSALEDHTVNVFSPAPARLQWCGRLYDRSPSPPARQRDVRPISHFVGSTPSGRAEYAVGCNSTALWVQTAPTKWRAYDLEGGP